jgi:hypothetical protein
MPQTHSLCRGLDEDNCVGPAGGYRRGAIADRIDLTSCYWDTHSFQAVDKARGGLFQVHPACDYRRRSLNRDWTGQTLQYRWEEDGQDDGVDVEIRATLPGPLFLPRKRCVSLRTLTEIHRIEDLRDGRDAFLGQVPDMQGGKFYLLKGRTRSMLLVASQKLSFQVVSHAFWKFTFPQKGGRLMLAPILDPGDIPTDADRKDLWLQILRNPPVSCRESYRVQDDRLTLCQEFPGACIAPIPPLLSHLSESDLMRLPGQRQGLLTGALGRYEYVRGRRWQATIELDWTRARIQPTRPVKGRLSRVPEELSYAGDVTYSLDDPMDRLLNLRIWAPLLGVAPASRREALLQQLQVPSAREYRRSLESVVEPVTGRNWVKEDKIFDLWGDVSYDPDWYNGLSLSGLERACRCDQESIAAAAWKTARELKETRAQLVAFYELFHCWAYCSAPSDPQATFWNQDCSHNGLEGLLAEARMRRDEGDEAGADRMLYLAGKTAAGLLAMQYAPPHARRVGYVAKDSGGPCFGCDGLVAGRGLSLTTADVKAPYNLANNFPEYAALLRLHGPLELLKGQVRTWQEKYPQRYRNWVRYYIGPEEKQRLAKMLQEDRVQSAVFYHLSPEVWLRRFVLEEDPESIEKRFSPALNLAEQLVLRSGMQLTFPPQESPANPKGQ